MMLHVHVCSLLIIRTVVYDVACSCMQSFNNQDSSL